MLHALIRRLRGADPEQLAFTLQEPPKTADELLLRLRALGLRRIERCSLTRNSRVMVSFRGARLRIHEGYLGAPESIHRGIVTFVEGRTAGERAAGRAMLLSYQVPRVHRPARTAPERTHPDDEPMALRLRAAHSRLNVERFDGALAEIPIRVSRRMRRRLGQYSAEHAGQPSEIAISRRHIRRHGWLDALETLVHEMVHQWQAETGRAIDHGRDFRRKAIAVGAAPRATRRYAS